MRIISMSDNTCKDDDNNEKKSIIKEVRMPCKTHFFPPDIGTLCAAKRHIFSTSTAFLQKYDNLSIKVDNIELLSEQSWPYYCTNLSVKIWESWTLFCTTTETRYSEILDLMNKPQLPFSYFTLYSDSIQWIDST